MSEKLKILVADDDRRMAWTTICLYPPSDCIAYTFIKGKAEVSLYFFNIFNNGIMNIRRGYICRTGAAISSTGRSPSS